MKNELTVMEQQVSQTIKNELDVKKDIFLERLNKRHKEHQNYKEFKQDQRNKNIAQDEGLDFFDHIFTERARDIDQRIRNVGSTNKMACGDIPVDLGKQFSDILQHIQELQGYLTSSTIFLADSKIKYFQRILNELTNSCDEMRQRLLPKKKFGFSNKKVAAKSKLSGNALDKVDAPEKIIIASQAFSWTIENRRDAHIHLNDSDVNGKDITISNLQHCLVELQGHAGSLQIKNVSDCTFLCGPISRSFFAEQCMRSTIAIACQQMRLHTSTKIRIYLHVTSRAIIEDCKLIEIATYNYDYENIEDDFDLAGLDKSQNNYTDVADFNWLSPDVHSPNWTLLKDIADPNWSEVRGSFNEKIITNSII